MGQSTLAGTSHKLPAVCYGAAVRCARSAGSRRRPRVGARLLVPPAQSPPPGVADPGSITGLKQQNASLAARSRSALVELYSLESRLREQQARVESLQAEVDAVSAERASVGAQLVAGPRGRSRSRSEISAAVRSCTSRASPTRSRSSWERSRSTTRSPTRPPELGWRARTSTCCSQARRARASLARLDAVAGRTAKPPRGPRAARPPRRPPSSSSPGRAAELHGRPANQRQLNDRRSPRSSSRRRLRRSGRARSPRSRQ